MRIFRSTRHLLFVTSCIAVVGCADDGASAEAGETQGGEADAGETTGGSEQAVEIEFSAFVGEAAVACGETYTGIGSMSTDVVLQDFRLYVSEVELFDGNAWVPVALEQDGAWQYDDIALLDFEDGTGPCAEAGTAETNTRVAGTVPEGSYVGLRFALGVPFEHNHIDVNATDTPSPLNLPSMFWNWAGGRKFIRVDLTNEISDPMASRWFIHLGSTGCDSTGTDAPPTASCAKPNLPRVELSDFDPTTDGVRLDLAALLEGVDVSTNAESTPPGCMSNPTDGAECSPLFPNFGLSWDTGACVNGCAGQTLFSVD